MEKIKTMDMVIKIRDKQYALTKDMSPDELIQFYRNRAETANNEALNLLKKSRKFHLKPGMPIYEDMLEIQKRKQENDLEFFTHKEIWDE